MGVMVYSVPLVWVGGCLCGRTCLLVFDPPYLGPLIAQSADLESSPDRSLAGEFHMPNKYANLFPAVVQLVAACKSLVRFYKCQRKPPCMYIRIYIHMYYYVYVALGGLVPLICV